LSGTVGNSNLFSIYLSVSLLMLLYFFEVSEKPGTRLVIVVAVTLLTIPLVLSGSRGGVMFIALAILWQSWRLGRRTVLVGAVISGIAVLLASSLPAQYLERITRIPYAILAQSDTVGLRFDLWKFAVQLWSEKPILGIGTGMFVELSRYSPALHGVKKLQAHSTYITHLVENGIIGLLFFLCVVLRATVNYERAIRLSGDLVSMRKLAITWESIMLVFLLNGGKGNLNTDKLMWISFALSVVISYLATREPELDAQAGRSPQ